MSHKSVTPVVNVAPAQLKDDKVSKIANTMNVSIDEATKLVARLEKQQAYRKQYQQSDAAKAYRAKRYQQMKLVAQLLKQQ